MSPIDRVAQRARAFTVLGVSASATQDDIRKAYRQLAFSKHPDHNPDTETEFALIAEAYRFVNDHAAELGIKQTPANDSPAPRPRTVSRPSVQAAEIAFDEATIADCQALLDAEGGPGAVHVSNAVYRVGRSLTFFVPAPIEKGRNEVAVPTGMLTDSRKSLPRIIAFDAREAVGGYFEMNAEDCAEHFPGARKIQIRFASA